MACRYFLFCCETVFYYVALAYTTILSSFLLLLKVIQWVSPSLSWQLLLSQEQGT